MQSIINSSYSFANTTSTNDTHTLRQRFIEKIGNTNQSIKNISDVIYRLFIQITNEIANIGASIKDRIYNLLWPTVATPTLFEIAEPTAPELEACRAPLTAVNFDGETFCPTALSKISQTEYSSQNQEECCDREEAPAVDCIAPVTPNSPEVVPITITAPEFEIVEKKQIEKIVSEKYYNYHIRFPARVQSKPVNSTPINVTTPKKETQSNSGPSWMKIACYSTVVLGVSGIAIYHYHNNISAEDKEAFAKAWGNAYTEIKNTWKASAPRRTAIQATILEKSTHASKTVLKSVTQLGNTIASRLRTALKSDNPIPSAQLGSNESSSNNQQKIETSSQQTSNQRTHHKPPADQESFLIDNIQNIGKELYQIGGKVWQLLPPATTLFPNTTTNVGEPPEYR